MENKYCKQCGKEILLEDTRGFWQWKNRVFCNKNCYTEFKKTVKHTEEFKQEMSKKMMGRKITWNEKLKGRVMSEENREEIRIRQTGKKTSEETKEKQRQAKLKNPTKYWLGKRFPLSGENHPNWKGGVEKGNIKIRHSYEIRNWRRLVFERDLYTCKKCNILGKYLNAHHILNFSSNENLRFDVDNGITFCEECHKKFHKIYGRSNNNIKQIKEFIIN